MTESVIRGKGVWERNNRIGCHTLLGEGAYFAPELGNVVNRRGGDEAFKPFLQAWMNAAAERSGSVGPCRSST